MEVSLGVRPPRRQSGTGGCTRTVHPFLAMDVATAVLLPFGLVDTIGAWTPLIVTFIAYTFFALEELGAQIEEPFGTAPNDLALDALARTIENSLREMLGEWPLPAEYEPKGFILT